MEGAIGWAAASPDFTPHGFFLCGHLKNRIYVQISNSRQFRKSILLFSIRVNFGAKKKTQDIIPVETNWGGGTSHVLVKMEQ